MSRESLQRSVGGHRGIVIVLLCLLLLHSVITSLGSTAPPEDDDRIYLLHSDELYYDAYGKNPDVQIVKGNVAFLHKGGHLTCDSAYFYEAQNSVRTMGHVHYWEGDTLSLTCERGFYDGANELMQARENVILIHNDQTLYTDSLDYDRLYEDAYFYDGGKLVEDNQQLVSDWGTYNTATKQAVFYYNVVLVTATQRVESDTLYYDTTTSLSHVVGPSTVYQDTIVIYTTDGFFDSETDQSRLYARSTVQDGMKTITGDSLFYNKNTGDAVGYGNVIYIDHENKNQLQGDYMQYNEFTGYGFTTIRALVKDYSQGSDTLFLHGDTIKLITYDIDTDSVYRLVHCYRNVRMFRQDMQGICDSLVGDSRDTCMTMYQDPVVWSDQRQILGEVIKVYMNDSTIRESHVIGQALSVERCDDENHYNQISSNVMDSYYVDGNIRQVHAIGNVKTLYYPVDEDDGSLMLLNYTETDTLRTFISPERQIEKMWTCKHVSDMYPMTQIPPDKYRLPKFAWHEDLRPKDKYDVFTEKRMAEEDKLVKQDRLAAPLQTLPPLDGDFAETLRNDTGSIAARDSLAGDSVAVAAAKDSLAVSSDGYAASDSLAVASDEHATAEGEENTSADDSPDTIDQASSPGIDAAATLPKDDDDDDDDDDAEPAEPDTADPAESPEIDTPNDSTNE